MKRRGADAKEGLTCLVTGATGLMGGHLVEALVAAGARVVALIRDEIPQAWILGRPAWSEVTRVRGDALDGALLTRILHDYDVDEVYHLAAQTQVTVAWRNPLDTFEINLRGAWLMMEAARSRGGATAVLLASTDKAYGPSGGLPYTEERPHQPTHPYDTAKSCAEAVARSYHASYGVPLLITRCGNLYGPGDLNFERLIPGTARALLRGERPVLRSDGTPRRDFVYVEDAVDAMLRLAAGVPWDGAAFNIGTSAPRTVLEAVEAIARALGRGDLPPDIRGDAAPEHQDQSLDFARIQAAVGWRPRVDLEAGLGRTLPWYRALFGAGG